MTKNILIFRTDRVGDLLLTCPIIYSIKKDIPNSKIEIVTSHNNYEYAKNLSIFEKVHKFPSTNIIKRLIFIYQLSKRMFDYVLVFDGKDRSILSSFIIKSNNKVAITSKKNFIRLKNYFNINIVKDDEKTDLIKIYKEALNLLKIDININNFDFLTTRNNNFSSEIPIKSYIHIHLDEKWFSKLYISSYQDINPSYENFVEFLSNISTYSNILITTGLINLELVENLKNKYFTHLNNKIYFRKKSKFNIYLIYKPSFEDIESLLRNSKILIACHGAITHAANSLNVKNLDILNQDNSEWYQRFTSYLKNYNMIYRKNFIELKEKLTNNLINL